MYSLFTVSFYYNVSSMKRDCYMMIAHSQNLHKRNPTLLFVYFDQGASLVAQW